MTLGSILSQGSGFLRTRLLNREEGFVTSVSQLSERGALGFISEELLPEQLPESDPDEPNEKSEDWWEYLRENADHLDSLEGTCFIGWQVDLYEYKGTYCVFHDAGVDEYDTYRDAKNTYKRVEFT